MTRRSFLLTALPLLLPAMARAGAQESAALADPRAEEMTRRLIEAVNAFRRAKGLAPLRTDPALTLAARRHSRYMLDSNRLSHGGPDGTALAERVEAAGYRYAHVSENIAAGYAEPEEVLDGWLHSQPHRVNLMEETLRDLGAAYHPGPIKVEDGIAMHVWTLILGTPRGPSARSDSPPPGPAPSGPGSEPPR